MMNLAADFPRHPPDGKLLYVFGVFRMKYVFIVTRVASFSWMLMLLALLLPATLAAQAVRYVDSDGVLHLTNVATIDAIRNAKEARRAESYRLENREPVRVAGVAVDSAKHGDLTRRYCDRVILETARRHELDPRLVRAVVQVESDYNPYAVSSKGALGLMQLMPETAGDLSVSNAFDIRENVGGGVRYLRSLLDRFSGNLPLALAAYNAGPSAVEKYGGTPPYPETIRYVDKVLTRYGRLRPKGNVMGDNARRKATAFSDPIYRIVTDQGSILYTNAPTRERGLRQAEGIDPSYVD